MPAPAHTSKAIDPNSMLKGTDAVIMAAAHSLGLTAQVVPVMQPEVYQLVCQANDQYDGSVRDHFLTGIASKLAFRHLRCPEDEDYKNQEQICRSELMAYNAGVAGESMHEQHYQEGLLDAERLGNRRRAILWIRTGFHYHQPGLAYAANGNQAVSKVVYTAAAIVIDVPEYKRHVQHV